MKKDVNQEIIIHKNQSNIFDIIGKEEDNNVKVKEFNILEFDRDKFSNFDLIQFGKNQYIAVEFGLKYDLSRVSLYLKTSDKRFVSHDTSEHNSFYEFIRISQPEVKETNEAVYGSFLFDTGLATVKKIDNEFDEDEVDTSSFKEMFEAMSKL